MSWYYAENGVQKGPVEDDEMQSLVRSGVVRSDTLVWREGMANWAPYGPLTGAGQPAAGGTAVAAMAAGDQASCAECGGVFPRKDMVAYAGQFVCAGCRDVFFQKIREGVAPHSGMNFGGFWIRALAKFIDSLALMAVNMVIQIPYFLIIMPMAMRGAQNGAVGAGYVLLNLLLVAAQLGVTIAYSVFFVGRYGATPGKMALSLKIVRADGGKVSYQRATGRAFSELLSGMILYIGYIMAGFDDEKRTLHDRICDTRVIKTN